MPVYQPHPYSPAETTHDGRDAHAEAEAFWLKMRSLMHGMDTYQLRETIVPLVRERLHMASTLKMPMLVNYYGACLAIVNKMTGDF